METLAFWMPGPWELAICAVLGGILGAVLAVMIVLIVLLGKRQQTGSPPAGSAPSERSPTSDETPPSDAESPV